MGQEVGAFGAGSVEIHLTRSNQTMGPAGTFVPGEELDVRLGGLPEV